MTIYLNNRLLVLLLLSELFVIIILFIYIYLLCVGLDAQYC